MDTAKWGAELGELRAGYLRIRAERLAASRQDPIEGTCRFCGRAWHRYTPSRMEGHAACVVGPAFLRELREFIRARPGITLASIGQALEVSTSTVYRWCRGPSTSEPAQKHYAVTVDGDVYARFKAAAAGRGMSVRQLADRVISAGLPQ